MRLRSVVAPIAVALTLSGCTSPAAPTPAATRSPAVTAVAAPSRSVVRVTASPSPTQSPAAPPSPSATPGPDYTFPGDLRSWVEKQIYATTPFYAHPKMPQRLGLGMINDEPQQVSVNRIQFTTAEFQGYVLGTELVEGHLIGYIGLKDGLGDQFFLPFNFGRPDSSDRAYLDAPRSAWSTSFEPGRYVSVERMRNVLDRNTNNTVIFSLDAYQDLPPDIKTYTKSRGQVMAQGAIALEVMQFCVEAKKRPYASLPLSRGLAAILNERMDHFDATGIPAIDGILPFKKP